MSQRPTQFHFAEKPLFSGLVRSKPSVSDSRTFLGARHLKWPLLELKLASRRVFSLQTSLKPSLGPLKHLLQRAWYLWEMNYAFTRLSIPLQDRSTVQKTNLDGRTVSKDHFCQILVLKLDFELFKCLLEITQIIETFHSHCVDVLMPKTMVLAC